MRFKKYQKVRRYGKSETRGINEGKVYIFPKLDGTNASLWMSDGVVRAGSRNRILSDKNKDNDNAGFCKKFTHIKAVEDFFNAHPNIRLYGEYLVQHKVKYKEEAMGKFYIFDVVEDVSDDEFRYLPYEEYSPMLEELVASDVDIEVLSPLKVCNNPEHSEIMDSTKLNTLFVEDGLGEGVVVKNYDFVNYRGDITWAKVISNEFKKLTNDKSKKVVDDSFESQLVDTYLSQAFLDKEYAKVLHRLQVDEMPKTEIGNFFKIIISTFIEEEILNILMENNFPVIQFNALKSNISKRTRDFLKSEGVI